MYSMDFLIAAEIRRLLNQTEETRT